MISRYYKYGIRFGEMAGVNPGDTIRLERDKVTVNMCIPPLRQGGCDIQRSAIVLTESGQQKLLLVAKDSGVPKLVSF